MNKLLWLAFLLMIVAQWWAPASMITQKQRVLNKGTRYKFVTAPIDPEDPFRGRYISLNFKENVFAAKPARQFSYGEKVYVSLQVNPEGFASIKDVSSKPVNGNDYVVATVSYNNINRDSSFTTINYPFDKYYMDEFKAPAAEKMYNERRMDSTTKTYALVSIYKGDAVIKDIYFNNIPLLNLLK